MILQIDFQYYSPTAGFNPRKWAKAEGGKAWCPMVNEPLPHNLTVGKLREILEGIPEQTVITLCLPPNTMIHPELTIYCDVKVTYRGGPVLVLSPESSTSPDR
jgi:hypothetical protein